MAECYFKPCNEYTVYICCIYIYAVDVINRGCNVGHKRDIKHTLIFLNALHHSVYSRISLLGGNKQI